MPLHDWANTRWWESFHNDWLTRLGDDIFPHLPPGFELYTGTAARIGLAAVKPDVGVLNPQPDPLYRPDPAAVAVADLPAPDDEAAVATVEPQRAVYVQYNGLIVAVVEVVSPRNKDRPSERADAAARYAGYVRGGVNLMLIDLVPRPREYSFADEVAADIGLPNQPPVPCPFAVVYRVGEESVAGGRYVAVWRRPLAVGQPLPRLLLPLSVHFAVPVDLEATYMHSARRTYLT